MARGRPGKGGNNLKLEEVFPERHEEYDGAVQGLATCDLLQGHAWGELKRRTGWRPARYLLRDGQGRVRAAFQTLEKELPGRLRFLYVPRGPAWDGDDLEALQAAASALRDLGRARRALFVKVDPDVPRPNPKVVEALRAAGFVPARVRPHWGGLQPVAVCRLPLEGSEEEVFARFRPKTRYNIRLASRRGVEVRQAGRGDLPAFHRIWEETGRRQGFGVRGLEHLEAVWDHLAAAGQAVFLLASYRGQDLAGALVAAFGPKAWYLYGGTRDVHREVMPMYAVQWEAIRWALGRGCRLYDFLGVSCHMNPKDPLYGLYRFKRGFNPDYTEFIGEFDLPLSPRLYRAFRFLEPHYLRGMRRLGRLRRTAGRVVEGAGRGGLGPL